jgi:hypothetical protein
MLGAVTLASGANQDASRGAVQISYDQFMKLDPGLRAARFQDANADTKAMIMRTHAERWLAGNRARLTSGQVTLVQEAIALVTPALYGRSVDPELTRKSQEVEAKFKCRLRHSDILAAFNPTGTPMPASWLDDMTAWFTGCLFG